MSYVNSIFCDESSHLERDHQPFMGLGGLVCPTVRVREHSKAISAIVERYHPKSPHQELKWVKVAPSNLELYRSIIGYFFEHDDLAFRVVIADKRRLDHSAYGQTHDEWYYKMYFRLLEQLISSRKRYNIYLDIKDTLGARKARKLRTILSNAMHDFDQVAVQKIQLVRSNESRIMQLSDVFIGAVCYAQHQMKSEAKTSLIRDLQKLSGFRLTLSTFRAESKFNIFHWRGGL